MPGEVISMNDARRIDAEMLAQIDEPALAERRDQRAGAGVDRIGALADEVEDPLALGSLPVGDAAIPQPDDLAVVVRRGIEGPDLLARRCVERDRLHARRGDVHPPTDDDRIDVHRRALRRVAGLVGPGWAQLVHVGGVDLRQRRVLVAFQIAAIHRPLDIGDACGRGGRPLLRGGERDEHCGGGHAACQTSADHLAPFTT